MPKATFGQVSFNAGELSPLLEGRIDLDRYGAGLTTCQNFIPIPQGGVRNRPGTKFIAEVKDSGDPVWLVPFQYSADPSQSYMLEHGDNYVRFYKNRAQIEDSGSPGTAYEVSTNYVASEWPAISFVQSADVMYMTHYLHTIHTLTRTSDASWTWGGLAPVDGPFLDDHSGGITLSVSGVTGSGLTMTASSAYFVDTTVGGHIGSIFLLWATDIDISALSPWEPDQTYAATDRVYYNGRIYVATDDGSSNKSGTVPPTHEEGERWDGKEGVNIQWAFESSFYGVAHVTAYTSSTQVTVEIYQRLPQSLATKACTRWAEGAWNGYRKWPRAVTFYQDRLVFGGNLYQPDTIWMSGVGDYSSFAPRDSSGVIAADLALTATVSSQQVNTIYGFAPNGNGLLCFTAGSEFLIAPATTNEGLSQANLRALPQTAYGSQQIMPVQIGRNSLTVQRGGRKVRSYVYDFSTDGLVSEDLTVLAEHITAAGGVIQMARMQEPYPIVWMCLGDGGLIGLTLDRDNQITAWHRHVLGGVGDGSNNPPEVESIAVIPSPSGAQDDLWMVVKRFINGGTKRYIEVLDMTRDLDGARADACFMDCAKTYSGSAATSITGLGHLEGATVQVVADGVVIGNKTVSSGAITLSSAASKVHVGFFPTGAAAQKLVTMKIEAGAAQGPAQSKKKKINRVVLRVYESAGGTSGSPDGTYTDALRKIDGNGSMASETGLFSGDCIVTWSKGHERNGQVEIIQDKPLPLNVIGLFADVDTQG